MDIFSTAAMNESLEHALTENTQPGHRYGHIIDESKDPRRRKQEKDTEERKVLPVRSGASAPKDHTFPDRAFQEKLSSPDPPSKAAPLVKGAEPTLRSGNIARNVKEPDQQIREVFTAGDDASSSRSGNPTTATERDRNIQSHNSLSRATHSDRRKSRHRRPPLWSVSEERYQELFHRAQSFNPGENSRAKQPISHNTEKAVLAPSLRTTTLLQGERLNDQEVSAAAQKIHEIVPTNSRSNVVEFNPPRPNEPRRSSQVVDTVSRLLEDNKGGVEYVKGVGVMRVEAEDASTERKAGHHLEKNTQINNDMTVGSNEERSFTIRHITTEYMDLVDVEIRWTAQTNAFAWFKDQQTLTELQAIPAQSIGAVWYHSQGQCFHLCLRAGNVPGLQRLFNELLLVMSGDPREFMMLKSLFEASIGAMKVNRADQTYFMEKAREFQNLRGLPRPTLSITEEPIVVVERSTLDDPARKAEDLPKPPEEDLDAAVDDGAAESGPDVEIDRELESVDEIVIAGEDNIASKVGITSEVEIATEVGIATEIDIATEIGLANEDGIASKVGVASRDGIASEVDIANEDGMQETALELDAAADARLPPKLLYDSGEAVTLGDLVIRLRNEDEIKSGVNQFDKLDVYDGPWVVSELPFSGATTPSALFEDDGAVVNAETPTTLLDKSVPPKREDKLKQKMQQKLVKLDFPTTSKAEPWTGLGRLRPVYGLSTGAESRDARTAYQQLQESNEGSIVNVDTAETNFDSENPTGVARIQEEAYVFVQYVSFEPVDEDTFEIERLRGKNLWRYSMEDCEDPVTDRTDPMIMRYLGHEGGYVKEVEALIVKYLVHWAGWPSEDDTWEVGYENIPQNMMKEYDASMGDFEEEGLPITKAIVDMTRAFKTRKRTKKKAKAGSVKNRKRKSAPEDPIVINSDSEDEQQEAVNKPKRRASITLVKAIQRLGTD